MQKNMSSEENNSLLHSVEEVSPPAISHGVMEVTYTNEDEERPKKDVNETEEDAHKEDEIKPSNKKPPKKADAQTQTPDSTPSGLRKLYVILLCIICIAILLCTICIALSLFAGWNSHMICPPPPTCPPGIPCPPPSTCPANKEMVALQQKIDELQITNRNLDTQHINLKTKVDTLEKTKAELEKDKDALRIKADSLEQIKNDLQRRTSVLDTTNKGLEKQSEDLRIRVSELIGNIATMDKTHFTKLENESPYNLQTQFRELYVNERTNAIEELKDRNDDLPAQTVTKKVLDILEAANNLTSMYSRQHRISVLESMTTLQILVPTDHEKRKYTEGENTHAEAKATQTTRVNITVDHHTLSAEQSGQIFDTRMMSALRMQEPLVEVLTDVIVNEVDIDAENQPNMMKYIRKCLEMCWMMNVHTKPMFIRFVEPSEGTVFDLDMYQPFLNAGKYIDYVVWPPLYMHEGGFMLSKGIAQGKE